MEITKRAVLIGINYFGSEAELSGCINDILDVKVYLESCGYTEFIILTDSPTDPYHLAEDSPTRKNILAALSKFCAATKAGDTLYVHYSGHGSQLDDQNGDEADGVDETICPVDMDWAAPDSGFIRDDTLYDVLVKPLAPGARLRVVFDSCHSGSALDLPFRWVAGTKFACENEETCGDVVFISGCKDSQTSADSRFSGRANGALTWALLKSLNSVKKTGACHWKELGELVRRRLVRGGYDQVPQLCFSRRDLLKKKIDLV